MRRRTFRRPMIRRKPDWQWIRFNSTQATPASPFTFDLLSDYKTQFGILMLPPDFTLWRLLIKCSIGPVTTSAPTADAGVLFSVFNESTVSGVPNALTQQYTEHFLMWDYIYLNKGLFMGEALATNALYGEWDIKTHRKIQNQEESFFAQVVTQGGVTALNSVSFTYSMLVRHSRGA